MRTHDEEAAAISLIGGVPSEARVGEDDNAEQAGDDGRGVQQWRHSRILVVVVVVAAESQRASVDRERDAEREQHDTHHLTSVSPRA